MSLLPVIKFLSFLKGLTTACLSLERQSGAYFVFSNCAFKATMMVLKLISKAPIGHGKHVAPFQYYVPYVAVHCDDRDDDGHVP